MVRKQDRRAVHPGDSTRFPAQLARLLAGAKQLWTVLLYSSAYLSVVTVVEVGIAMVVLSLPPSPAPAVVGLLTFAVYANDRIADADDDARDKPGQVAFVRRHENALYVAAAVAYGLAVSLAMLGGPLALALALLPGAFWVLYASDWLPRLGAGLRRLKDILVVNTAVVALAWSVSLTFLPLAFADRGVTPTVVVVFAYFFLRSFVDAELPNVSDRAGDADAGVRTLPVVVGLRGTRYVLYAVDVATAAVFAYAVAAGYLSVAVALALGAGLAYSLAVTSVLARYADRAWLTVAPELEYVVAGAALSVVALA
ncbi:UbiA family prenyltransferase [Halobacterium hubeiense]|uniref:UbiA family prenyltransferase n=1 Tax=Halobacterium hubeiense TaxID=1407499 RepID=A0A0U5ADI5_9EURY|nr:UbiA family prenyltransferase [Halobacterium hubeiense]CQH54058.1 UbiA family prenyltransferase [Halobacterium hubeiense]